LAGCYISGNKDSLAPRKKTKILSEHYPGKYCKVADVRSNDRQKTERTRTQFQTMQDDKSAIRDILGGIVGLPSSRIIGLFSNEDLLMRRYYIPSYGLILSDTPDCRTVGGDDSGVEDIEVSSGCKFRQQWGSLNSKEETEKSDDEEIHGEMLYGKREIKLE
jgi:hypothetical protein